MDAKIIERMIGTQSGVVFLTGAPGSGKSSFGAALANHIGQQLHGEPLQYIDLRLSQMEETDVGLFPKDKGDCVGTLVPEWAVAANQRPSLIHFEELNRCKPEVMNAALQPLCERAIGYSHHFNEGVYMMASGNLGEKDGTDVEELDAALNNRLIHIDWKLTVPNWKYGYADANVNPIIVEFLEANPQYLHRRSEQEKAWASARSWSNLSDFVGKDADINQVLRDVSQCGHCYIGSSVTKFSQWLRNRVNLSMDTILNEGFDKVKKDLDKLGRAQRSDLVLQLKSMELEDMNQKELEQVEKFIVWLEPDEMVGYLAWLLDRDELTPAAKRIIKPHHAKLKGML